MPRTAAVGVLGRLAGVTAKNAVDDWLGRMAVNKEMVCETPASPSISGEKYRCRGSRSGSPSRLVTLSPPRPSPGDEHARPKLARVKCRAPCRSHGRVG